MWGVRDPYILIKVKKICVGYFCTKTHFLSPMEKNILEKFFLNHQKNTNVEKVLLCQIHTRELKRQIYH